MTLADIDLSPERKSLGDLTIDLAPHKRLGMTILTTEDVNKREALYSQQEKQKYSQSTWGGGTSD